MTTTRPTTVIGPVTGYHYAAVDTGETWNGNPVLAFTSEALDDLVSNGDGADSNGEGLAVVAADGGVSFLDWTDGKAEDVPTRTVDGVTMWVPQGRAWDQVDDGEPVRCEQCGGPVGDGETHLPIPGTNMHVVLCSDACADAAEAANNAAMAAQGILDEADPAPTGDVCRVCGEHISAPHAPECPIGRAVEALDDYDADVPEWADGDGDPATVAHSLAAALRALL